MFRRMFRYWTEDSPAARDFSTILVGLLSESTQGAADPNELLRIASTIRCGNREDWTRSFLAMADRVFAIAGEAAQQSRPQTASESYLRAFTYYRVAELMRGPDDPPGADFGAPSSQGLSPHGRRAHQPRHLGSADAGVPAVRRRRRSPQPAIPRKWRAGCRTQKCTSFLIRCTG